MPWKADARRSATEILAPAVCRGGIFRIRFGGFRSDG
jgi:hypothetical protein